MLSFLLINKSFKEALFHLIILFFISTGEFLKINNLSVDYKMRKETVNAAKNINLN